MAAPATLKIQIIADAAKAVSGLGQLDDAAGKAATGTEKAGSKLGNFARTAAKVAGAAALGGLIAMFKTGVTEQSDYLAGQAQLANGIKSTGNAANVSVKGLEALATSIQGYSGQTDDSIVASEKLLLTFTNVRNAAGKNNDIFNQATKMTADMAAKMGGDASTYAVQLGKALNDPAKGLSKLTRIGVTFTDAQKKQVTAMQAAGDTVGAQKVIMAELTKEFGGSAKAAGDTLPGQMQRAKRAFEDVSQGVVAGLMPILTQLASILLKNVMPAFAAVMGFITQHQTAFGILAAVIGTIVVVVKSWTIAQAILNSTLLANPIFLIVAGIVALGAALVIAYQKSETFRHIVQSVFAVVKAVVMGVVRIWVIQFRILVAIFQTVWRAFQSAFRAVVSIARTVGNAIVGAIRAIVTRVGSIARTIFAIYTAPYRLAFQAVMSIIHTFWPRITSAFSSIVSAIGRVIGVVFRAITTPFAEAWGWIKANVIDKIPAAFAAIGHAIAAALSGLADIIKAPFIAAWQWISSHIISPLKTAWNGIAGALNAVHISFHLPGWIPGVGGKGFDFRFPHIPTLARGGVVDRATLAVIGEGRAREVVAPEPMLRRLIRDELADVKTEITVNGALDPDAVARQIESLLQRRRRRNGGPIRQGAPILAETV